jgi:hypothetical protein
LRRWEVGVLTNVADDDDDKDGVRERPSALGCEGEGVEGAEYVEGERRENRPLVSDAERP